AFTLGMRRGQSLPAVVRAPVAGAWSRGEISVLAALGLAIAAWLLPGVLDIVVPGAAATTWIKTHLTQAVVALRGGCLLFVLRGGGGRPALTWREAAGIDWGVILLFGGGILLGDLARQTGLADLWGHALVNATGAGSTWTMTALVTAAAIVVSEATS